MKRIAAYAGVLVFGLAMTVGAAGPAEEGEHHGTMGQAAKGTTLTGCLEKGDEPNTFLLTNASSKGGKNLGKIELIGAPASLNLKEHIGHKVEVNGQMTGAAEAERIEKEQSMAEGAKPSKKMEHEGKEQHLQVKSVHHLASSCS
jgi:hypothetical protein